MNTLVILAAGIGSRYGGIKQLEKVGPSGESLIDYSMFNALKAGFQKIVFVIRKDIETQVRSFFSGKTSSEIEMHFVHQELENIPNGLTVPQGRVKPWGTGQAVLVCKEILGNDPFVMINGDDYYAYESLKIAHDFLISADLQKPHYAIVGYKLKETLSDFGSVSRGICKADENGSLTHLEEHKKVIKATEGIISIYDDGKTVSLTGNEPVSMNLFAFTPAFLAQLQTGFDTFLREHADELNAEFFIPAYLGELISKNNASVEVLPSSAQWFGITYKEDAPLVKTRLAELATSGVYPSPLF